MNAWYILQTKPHKEGDVATLLKKADFEVFLPKVTSLRRGVVPLFPMYLFVRADLEDAAMHRMVKYTRGVNRVLGHDGRPVPVVDDVVEIIRVRLGRDEVLEHNHFVPGRKVFINKGPFKDLEGVLEKPVSASGRVAVLLSVYGKTVRMNTYVRDLAVA